MDSTTDPEEPLPIPVHEFEPSSGGPRCTECERPFRHVQHWHSFRKSKFAIVRGSGTKCECGLPMSSQRHIWRAEGNG